MTFSAGFDSRRTELSPQLRMIAELFQNPANWTSPTYARGLLEMRFTKEVNIFPELLRVKLDFPDGTAIESAVEVVCPDFALRDLTTGIPLEPCNENILRAGKTIVDPLPSRTTSDESDFDIAGEEEDLVPPPMAPDSLSDDPDFDREPQGVQFAKSLARADTTQLNVFRRRISAFRSQIKNPGQKVVLDALSAVMEALPT